jgi:hypothetical protein
MEAGKRRLAGDAARATAPGSVLVATQQPITMLRLEKVALVNEAARAVLDRP